jgi:raffinose/stachyose/melibiose transport system permease protein
MSFHKWKGFGKPEFIGLDNYHNLFANEEFLEAISHNFIFMIVALGIMGTLSFLIALFIDSGMPGGNAFRGLFFLPVIIPMVVIGLVWSRVYSSQGGLLNQLLGLFGLSTLQHDWLGDPGTALAGVLVVWVWRHFGYGVIMFYAGLLGIPRDIKDAAAIDGAKPWQTVWHVIIPLMRSIIFIVAILFAIWAFKVFALIFILTGGGPYRATEVVTTFMYDEVFQYYKLGIGSAISILILVILVLFSVLRNRFQVDVEF